MPTAKSVLGFDLGEREVTTAESDRCLSRSTRPARSSGHVLATSNQGRPLRYAVVGAPARVARRAVGSASPQLRDPATPSQPAARSPQRARPSCWVAGNVHGGEESGADASLQVLYELAAVTTARRRSPRQRGRRILPTQNPDGREAERRRNAYGFDMNRDWFARTQPETDGKLELLRQYPPQLFIDAHEMGGTRLLLPAERRPDLPRDRRRVGRLDQPHLRPRPMHDGVRPPAASQYFNYDVYDLFYMGYGDTVPTTGFGAAGMTYEKGSDSAIATASTAVQHPVGVPVGCGAAQRAEVLTGCARSVRDALPRQGAGAARAQRGRAARATGPVPEVPDIRVRATS